MSLEKLARADLWSQAGYPSRGAGPGPQLRLNCNENPWPPPGADDPLINRYPEKQPARLVERLAERYGIAPQNLLVTRGADDGIDALIRSFCTPAGDSIVQCPPAFVMYGFFARLQGVQVLDVPLVPEAGFAVDFAGLEGVPEGKIFFLCAPNNPTGSLIDARQILDFATQREGRSLVVVDEAYIEFASVPGLASEAAARSNLVVLRTLSKAWSLAGARLGVVIGSEELVAYLRATTSPYPLSRPAIAAALAATTPENTVIANRRIEVLKIQRESLRKSLAQFDFVREVYPSQANFLLLRVADAGKLLDFMAGRGVLLRDQSGQPGLDNHVRISIGSAEEMEQLVERMNEFAGEMA